MAFRAPQQRPQQVRQQSHQHQDPATAAAQQQRKRPLDESQDWILFAPPSQTTSQTPRTADLSRASYFGSLETGVRSDLLGSDDHIVRQVTASHDDDATELDSLDDGLHDFHTDPSQRLDQSGGAVLPTHDGMGSFPTAFPTTFGNNEALQDQLWQHERYNPQRRQIHRRLSSVQRRLDALDDDDVNPELDPQEERRLRVERWRTEQSKAVLEEIERETRRRYRRAKKDLSTSSLRLSSSAPGPAASVITGFESVSTETSEPEAETDSFWRRITRRVIRDLIGLDDNTLSVIFGQELPEELSATPTRDSPLDTVGTSASADRTWESKLMNRVARELNLLVYQLSELESAFTTYSSRIPPPSTSTTAPRRASTNSRPHPRPLPTDLEANMQNIFRPTLGRSPISGPDASLWGIEEEPATAADNDADYWERDPSLKMLFSYIRRRIRPFSASSQATETAAFGGEQADSPGPLPAEWATSASALGTSPSSQRRADLIRRNHPLVSRAAERHRRETNATTSASAVAAAIAKHRQELLGAALALHRRRGSSGCGASQHSATNKRSRRSSGTGQSRKYWDFAGGSVEGSIVSSAGAAAAAAAGGWGEV